MRQLRNTPVNEGDATMLTGDLLRVRIKDMTIQHREQIYKIHNYFDRNTKHMKHTSSTQGETRGETSSIAASALLKLPSKTIEPIFISSSSKKQCERSDMLLEIFARALEKGGSRDSIESEIQDMAQIEVDHKVLHGLAKILLNRCVFQSPSPELQDVLSPSDIRHITFLQAAKMRKENNISRNDILASVVTEIKNIYLCQMQQEQQQIISNLTIDMLENYLYADLKEHHVLLEMDKNTPKNAEQLISRYNLALCQSLLLRATEMDVYIDFSNLNDVGQENTLDASKWLRFLFRHIKFQQLMYRIWQVQPDMNSNLYHIRIDGPQSIFQKSNRYGMQLALFLPALILFPGKWYATATVLWGDKRKVKRLFCLSNKSDLVSHYKVTGVWRSSAEENFEYRFQDWLAMEKTKGIDVQWSLQVGKMFCLEDGSLCISDFTLQHPLGSVHVEMLGYWTKKDAMQRKRKPKDEHYIWVVSKNLMSDNKSSNAKDDETKLLNRGVIVYRDMIPIKKIMECARGFLKIV